MKIQRFVIKKLFGMYDYDIKFFTEEYITILHASNGKGKTTILNLITAIMGYNITYIDTIPFESCKMIFDNSTVIKVKKESPFDCVLDRSFNNLASVIMRKAGGVSLPFVYIVNNIQYKVSIKRESFYQLKRDWIIYKRNNVEMLNLSYSPLSEIINELDDAKEYIYTSEVKDILNDIEYKCNINLVHANRIFEYIDKKDEDDMVLFDAFKKETVDRYSDHLRELIEEIREEKVELSDKLDRSFPYRVMKNYQTHYEVDMDYVKKEMENITKRRSNLQELGIVLDDIVDERLPEMENYPLDMLKMLEIYINDSNQKLDIFNDLVVKISTLLNIVNDRNSFSDKFMQINSNGDMEFVSKFNNKRIIPLSKLSSGEKNTLILFYNLIFRSDKHSIVLIDEPEISLHISWQQTFLQQLLDICKLNDIQAIVATHSPDIINNYDEFMVGLEESNNDDAAKEYELEYSTEN